MHKLLKITTRDLPPKKQLELYEILTKLPGVWSRQMATDRFLRMYQMELKGISYEERV